MKIDKHTYVDINAIELDNVKHYLVTFTKVYKLFVFGKVIKEFKKIQEVPFVFPEYDIAKEFCELNPQYKKCNICKDNISNEYRSIYETYELILNKKVKAYIIWNNTILTYNWAKATYSPDEIYPIILGFVKDELNNIILPTSHIEASKKYAPRTPHIVERLSDIFTISKTDKHHFELVEE